MYVPKRAAAATASRTNSSSAATSVSTTADKKKAVAAADVLFDLETYVRKRDYIGALTLLRLERQQSERSDSSSKRGGVTNADVQHNSLRTRQTNTWWRAFCYFQCSDYASALESFDDLLQADESAAADAGTSAADSEAWRLGRACCLYYLGQFEAAEHAALGVPRHALCNRLLFLVAHSRAQSESVLLERYKQLSASSPDDMLALAATSFAKRNFDESIDVYKHILLQQQQYKLDGTLDAIHVYLAMCYYRADAYDIALELVTAYLATHADSFVATNLKACCYYRLYSGDEATQVLEAFTTTYPQHPSAQASSRDALAYTGMRDVARHNAVVFRESSGKSGVADAAAAVATLTPLVGVLDETRLNLVLCYVRRFEYERAFALIEALEPTTSSEHVIKGILHGVIGEATDSKEHVFLAEKCFHTVGSSPDETDTIVGRQAMASYYMLRKEFADASVYLRSIAPYVSTSDAFHWNFGMSLAAAGDYAEAEEVLLRVQSERLRTQLVFCSWLARCYIANGQSVSSAWELYLQMVNTSDAYRLLKVIANDCYAAKQFYFAVKAFDVLERLDPDPEYWEAKRGACVGFFQQIATGATTFDAHRSDDVLKLLQHSKNALEASKLTAILKKWVVGTVSARSSSNSNDSGAGNSSSSGSRGVRAGR